MVVASMSDVWNSFWTRKQSFEIITNDGSCVAWYFVYAMT